MLLPHDTIVVVADGTKAHFYRNKGVEPHINLVAVEGPELKLGNHGSGSRHHSSSANPDRARLEEDSFAAALASHLNAEAAAGRIDSLFVIADPRSLGELRRHLHATARARVLGEVAKDLTGHVVGDIEAAIAGA